ncbi:hypothetical protein LCGC14_1818760 [marine sediment metagenome]|uniref:Uncharacterized protein n=1 Tax=marine sediment metagenome TaxID=412755 RepID=A0A0F9IZC5_9ZZZZ
MGLDQFLYAKKWIWSSKGKTDKAEKVLLKEYPEMKDFELKEISYEVGYWRKSNHIHKWFVDNVQDGKDDCKNYYVSEEQLRELLNLVKNVLDKPNKAEELLPTTSGFFFGGEEYDEWYFNDLKNTIKIIEKIFNKINLKEWDIYYSSSW